MSQASRSLEGKVVMVTGASSGIGREICLYLAKEGCRILAAARRIDRLSSLCDEINGFALPSTSSSSSGDSEPSATRAVAVELDVSAKGSVIEASANKAWDAFGRIDALVNNAGIRGGVHSSLDWSEEEWDTINKTNLIGLWLLSKHVCSHMREAKQKGCVINISSIAGLERGQLPGGLAYAASKAGVNALTRVMAVELGVYGIRVNSISPGLFKSEITEGLMQRQWLQNVTLKTIPLQENGTVDPAITSLVRYLIDDLSEYVTGNIFIIDSGATLPGVPIFSSL